MEIHTAILHTWGNRLFFRTVKNSKHCIDCKRNVIINLLTLSWWAPAISRRDLSVSERCCHRWNMDLLTNKNQKKTRRVDETTEAADAHHNSQASSSWTEAIISLSTENDSKISLKVQLGLGTFIPLSYSQLIAVPGYYADFSKLFAQGQQYLAVR